MSRVGITALFDRVLRDDSFRDQLVAAASNEQRRRLVVDAGYDVDASDLPALREMTGPGELSDEELEQVAAGGVGTEVSTGAVAAAVVAGVAIL